MCDFRRMAVGLCFFAGGCAGFDLAKYADVADAVPTSVTFKCESSAEKSFAQDYRAVRFDAASVAGDVPARLGDTDAMKAVSKVFGALAAPGRESGAKSADAATYLGPSKAPSVSVSADDMKVFFRAFAETMATGATYTGASVDAGGEKSAGERELAEAFKDYYRAYLKGKFVTRTGKTLAKAEIKNGIGNDALTGALTVFLEVLHDVYLKTPVLVAEAAAENKAAPADGKASGKIYYPGVNDKKPTGAELGYVDLISVAADSRACGVTKREAEAIAFLSGLAGEKSAILSGLAIEAFGGLELSFVVGGHFSVGDNKTLAELTKAFFESLSRRTAERGAYEFFWHFAYATKIGGNDPGAADDGAAPGPGTKAAVGLAHFPGTGEKAAPDAKIAKVAAFLEGFH